ncbi:MAG: DUF1559 domain-containing protein [Planctomycetes bacterium]|nr:DUF1559 domain-containing protein [Planctomycetota bacterium]
MRSSTIVRAVLGCVLALLATSCPAIAQPADSKLPEGLRFVPPDAMGFVYFRSGEFTKSVIGKGLVDQIRADREGAKGLKKIEGFLGVDITDVESVTVLMLPVPKRSDMPFFGGFGPGGPGFFGRPKYKEKDWDMKKEMPFPPKFEDKKFDDKKEAVEKFVPVLFQDFEERRLVVPDLDPREMAEYIGLSGPLWIVTATKPLDRKKMLKAQLMEDRFRDPYGPRFGMEPSVIFLSDRSVLFGVPWELARYSDVIARNPEPKAKPMQAALALGSQSHLIVAGGYMPPEVRRFFMMPFMSEREMRVLAAVAPLLATEAAAALNLSSSIDLTLQFKAANAAAAGNALQAIKSLRVLAEFALDKSKDAGEAGGWKLDLQNGLAKTLANAKVEQAGTTVSIQLKLDITPAMAKHFGKEILDLFRQRGDRVHNSNNLKQIGLALWSYHDSMKSFPPAGIGDRDGKPLLSWRVAILPYIEEFQLYKEFDLNQPWDHPTNKKLISRMPRVFMVPGAETKDGETHYRVLVGGGAMFEARQATRLANVTDGLSNTFLVVEANEPTIWTKPDDLPFNPNGPLPKFGVWPEGFHVVLGDGSVRYVRSTTAADVLRAYITRNGGEVAPPLD